MAFYSGKLYRDVARRWEGGNLAYLFILLAVCWIAPVLNLREQVVSTLGSSHFHIMNQIPDIYITNGRLVLEQTTPQFITNEAGTTVAIIDTTGSMNFIFQDSVNLLLTETSLTIRRGAHAFNTFDLSRINEFHLSKGRLGEYLLRTRRAIAPFSYGLFLMISYMLALLVLLGVAGIGYLLSKVLHSSLRFSAILRMAAVALTPSIILITLSAVFRFPVPAWVYPAGTLAYLLFGIRSCRKEDAEQDVPRIDLTTLLEEPQNESDTHSHAA